MAFGGTLDISFGAMLPRQFSRAQSGAELSAPEQQEIRRLKNTDSQVRKHETAHLVAAGQYSRNGINYRYQMGPDGNLYAVGGSVDVDVSPGSTPQETLKKADVLKNAALAPADPSPGDFSVAAAATALEIQARMQIARESGDEFRQQIREEIFAKLGSSEILPAAGSQGAGNLEFGTDRQQQDAVDTFVRNRDLLTQQDSIGQSVLLLG